MGARASKREGMAVVQWMQETRGAGIVCPHIGDESMLNKLWKRTTITQDQEGLDVPPGQFVTEKFPVLTFGPTPQVDLETWRMRVFGLVEEEVTLDWDGLLSLGTRVVEAPFHCVTQWSRLENTWEGVPFSALMELAKPKPEAAYVMAHCYGGYTTNIALDVMMDDDVILAHRHDGEPLSPEHGGPLRLVVPKRYGWKSAKWLNGIELMAADAPGFWETRGYHMNGDPIKEERFWDSLG